jgi:hypothetical protein
MDHIIMADDSKEIEIHSKWLDWTWSLGQLFQQPENEMVTTAIDKLRTKISSKFDAEVLLHEPRKPRSWPKKHHSTTGARTSLIGMPEEN